MDKNNNINKELASIYDWLFVQKECLNVSKTKHIMFHMPPKQVLGLKIKNNKNQ